MAQTAFELVLAIIAGALSAGGAAVAYHYGLEAAKPHGGGPMVIVLAGVGLFALFALCVSLKAAVGVSTFAVTVAWIAYRFSE